MSATLARNTVELSQQIELLEVAASKLITRLADRAAYATGEEYNEIRSLMTALRQIGGTASSPI